MLKCNCTPSSGLADLVRNYAVTRCSTVCDKPEVNRGSEVRQRVGGFVEAECELAVHAVSFSFCFTSSKYNFV